METIKYTSLDGVVKEITLEEACQRIKSLELTLQQANAELAHARELLSRNDKLISQFTDAYRQSQFDAGADTHSSVAEYVAAEDMKEGLRSQFK